MLIDVHTEIQELRGKLEAVQDALTLIITLRSDYSPTHITWTSRPRFNGRCDRS